MFLIGIVLLILGFVLGVHLLWVLGVILAVVGGALLIADALGHRVGGRRYY